MLSLAEISDRLEIQQLLIELLHRDRQSSLRRPRPGLHPDAHIDYTAMGGIAGPFGEVKAWLAEVMPNFPAYYHMLGNVDVRVDGDTATSRSICFNPMKLGDDGQIMFCGLWYDDEFLRTADGWRMTRRVETKCIQKFF